ncbi:MAG TPA: hypothetical protein VFK21_08205 [Gammaproteobacteria bacterium]|nr:hypothetical protein [Gammaproteobacteria bacterium]
MGDLFRASKVKLSRARQFIEEVDAGLQAYDSSNPTTVELDWKGSMKIHRKEVPPVVLATLGDAIHNMRAALDLMAAELARVNGKSDKKVYFPFAESKEELSAQINSKHFDRAGDDAVSLLKTFEPHKGGNEKLRAIHDLDIRDKHINILVTRLDTNNLEFSFRRGEDINKPIPTSGSYSHKFLDGALAGLPLIETLKELVQLVDGIIEEFARMVEQREANNAVSGKRPTI